MACISFLCNEQNYKFDWIQANLVCHYKFLSMLSQQDVIRLKLK